MADSKRNIHFRETEVLAVLGGLCAWDPAAHCTRMPTAGAGVLVPSPLLDLQLRRRLWVTCLGREVGIGVLHKANRALLNPGQSLGP